MSHEEKPVLEGVSKEIENILLDHGFVWSHGVRNRNVYKHESGAATISYGGISFTCSNYKYTPRSVYARGTYVLTEAESKKIENKLKMMVKKHKEMQEKKEEKELALAEDKKAWDRVLDTLNLDSFGYEIKPVSFLSSSAYAKITYNNHTLKVFDKNTLSVEVVIGGDPFNVHVEKAFKLIELLEG